MRTRVLTAVAALFLVLAAVAVASPGAADDNTDGRLADLETRVAALETQVAMSGDAGADTSSSQQRNSSSSSRTSGNNAFTGSYSGSGDREIELEIDDAGT